VVQFNLRIYSLAYHCGSLSSISEPCVWDSWWTK